MNEICLKELSKQGTQQVAVKEKGLAICLFETVHRLAQLAILQFTNLYGGVQINKGSLFI